VLRSADAVVATTKMSARSLAARCETARSAARVAHIYNGYDPDDFAGPRPAPAAGKFTLAYTGTLWNLTSIEPLVAAVETLLRDTPDARQKLEVVIAGRATGSQQPFVDRLVGSGITVRSLSYLPHHEAVNVMRGASALCVVLSAVPGAERVVPAKLFEYMAAERPILGILPAGEASDILSRSANAVCLRPDDVRGIAAWLRGGITDQLPAVCSPSHGLEEFRRDAQALALGSLLDQAISARRDPGIVPTDAVQSRGAV
jgi:glycosyltransferase involved in cell wall biosynthesis